MNMQSRSEHLYALLISLLPRGYRKEYGEDMLFAFRDMLEEQPAKKVWLTALKEFPSPFRSGKHPVWNARKCRWDGAFCEKEHGIEISNSSCDTRVNGYTLCPGPYPLHSEVI